MAIRPPIHKSSRLDITIQNANTQSAIAGGTAVEPHHWRAVEDALSGEERTAVTTILSGEAKSLNELSHKTGIPRARIASVLTNAMAKTAIHAGTWNHKTPQAITAYVAQLDRNNISDNATGIVDSIRMELQIHPSHQAYWRRHNKLNNLYQAAYARDEIGDVLPRKAPRAKRFFGHGSWYSFLSHEVGITPLRTVALEDGTTYRRNFFAPELLTKIFHLTSTNPLNATHWDQDPSLHEYYAAVKNRDSYGRNIPPSKRRSTPGFWGHGSWDMFLEKQLGINLGTPARSREKMSSYKTPDAIHDRIRNALASNIPLHEQYWQGKPELSKLFRAAYRRDASGKQITNFKDPTTTPFFGHGTWYAYLEHEFGVVPRDVVTFEGKTYSRALTNDEIHQRIHSALQAVPAHSGYWFSNPNLNHLYSLVQRRTSGGEPIPQRAGVKKTGFWGHGDWYSYLEKEHGVTPLRTNTANGTTYSRPYFTDELLSLIARKLTTGTPANARSWKNHPQLNSAYSAAAKRDSNGNILPVGKRANNGFFGHGTWNNLVQHLLEQPV